MTKYNNIAMVVLMVIAVGCSSIETPQFNNAPIPYIDQPSYGKVYQDKVSFIGSGQEVGDFMVWTSSIDGVLSNEPNFDANLTPGKHTILYTITRDGVEEFMEIDIHVQKPRKLRVVAAKKGKGSRRVVAPDGGVFIVNYDKQTIHDMSTGLMWSRYALDYKHPYKEAQMEANSSTLGGYTNWRVPTLRELKDVGNIKYDGRAALMCGEFNLGTGAYWASNNPHYKIAGTTSGDVVELKPSGKGLSFYMSTGIMNVNTLAHVLIVRRAS